MLTFKTEDGVAITYRIKGNGQPLIMIHGINGNQKMFEPTINALSSQYQVISYDVRGHGQSDKPDHYTLDDQIEDLRQLLKHLNIDKAHILGFSMGAYIALGFAVHYPDNLDKLVLVGGKAHTTVSSFARLMIQHRQEIKGMTKEEMKRILNKYIYYQTELAEPWLNSTYQYYEMTEEEEAVASRSIAGFDYRDGLYKINNDVLLIAGRHDGLNPVEESRKMNQHLRNGKLTIYEQSGHAPFVEEPERFQSDIIRFIG